MPFRGPLAQQAGARERLSRNPLTGYLGWIVDAPEDLTEPMVGFPV
jgi:hypothetical protein